MGKPATARRQQSNQRQNNNHRKTSREYAPPRRDVGKDGFGGYTPVKAKSVVPKTAAQRIMIQSILSKVLTFATGCAGTGKAQPLDARIRTPDGWSTMGDMEVGSQVIAPDGTTASVVNVYPQGGKDIYRITFADGRTTECCDDHLWRVYRYAWAPEDTKWRVASLKDIRTHLEYKSNKGRLYVQLPEPEQKADIALPIDPYLLGILLGDGHLGKASVAVTNPDPFIVEEVTRLIPDEFELVQRDDLITYGIVRKDRFETKRASSFLDDIRALGLAGSLSDTKFIPEQYLEGSPAQKLALLQGLLDTDGTCDAVGGSVSFCSTSYTMVRQVQELVRSLGGLAKIGLRDPHYTYKGEYLRGKPAYVIGIRHKDPRSLFRLPRKRDRTPENYQYKDSLRLRIERIEYVGKKEAQCIAIDHPDHLYITDSYIVTHNTHVALGIAVQLLLEGLIDKIILTKPFFEIDEKLGLLPGGVDEKTAVLKRSMSDILVQMLGASHFENLVHSNTITFEPLGSILGLNFHNACVIIDEAQNTTPGQMKALLTRTGMRTKVVVCGDYKEQRYLEGRCGLEDALDKLGNLPTVGHVDFTPDDIVRSGFCKDVILAYRDTAG